MSVKWITWAWDQDVASGAKLTLIALADHAGEDGFCWPASGRIATKTGHSKSTVFAHFALLEDRGLIWRETRERGDGSQTSSMVHLGCRDPESGSPPDPESGSLEPSSSLEPSGNLFVPSGDDEPFEKFWKRYPHNGNDVKQKARLAWRAMVRRGDLETLRAAWPAWAREIESREPKHRPHASTFLSKKYYENEVGTAEPPVRRQQERAPIASSDNQPGGILHGD